MSPLTWGVLDMHVQVGLLVLDVPGFQSLALKPVPNRLGGISFVHTLTRSAPYLRATNLDAIPLTNLTSCFPSSDLANFCLLKDIVKSFQRS